MSKSFKKTRTFYVEEILKVKHVFSLMQLNKHLMQLIFDIK